MVIGDSMNDNRKQYLEDSVHTFDLQATAIHWEAMLHHRVLTIRKLDLSAEAIHRVLQERKRYIYIHTH